MNEGRAFRLQCSKRSASRRYGYWPIDRSLFGKCSASSHCKNAEPSPLRTNAPIRMVVPLHVASELLLRLLRVELWIVSRFLDQLVVAVDRRVGLQNVQDEAFLNGLSGSPMHNDLPRLSMLP